MESRPRRSRNYGELSQRGTAATTTATTSRGRSLSPDRRSPSNSIVSSTNSSTLFARSRTPISPFIDTAPPTELGATHIVDSHGQLTPGKADCTSIQYLQQDQEHQSKGTRSVSGSTIISDCPSADSRALTLANSPVFPPNLQKARHRIVSDSSVMSIDSLDSADSYESYLSAPMVYKPGLSPLESCLPIYPVISGVLSFLSSRDILPLYLISRTFKSYLESTYASLWNEVCLCKSRQWISMVYIARTAREKMELDPVYRHMHAYILWKFKEEQRALREMRARYDYEVAFILSMELGCDTGFVSGGYRNHNMAPEWSKPRGLMGGREFEPMELVVKVENTRPGTFFYSDLNASHLGKFFLHAQAKLNRGIPPSSTDCVQFVKSIIIDGTNVKIESLSRMLEHAPFAGRLEGLSAMACTELDLNAWARYLEMNPRGLGKLKWLKMYPNETFPLSSFHHDATKSSVLRYFRHESHHPTMPPRFPSSLSLTEHLSITLPLLMSNSPIEPSNLLNVDNKWLRSRKLKAMWDRLRPVYYNQQRQFGRWVSGPYISHLHPALKVLALCKARGIDVNYNLCAAGVRCMGWKIVDERRKKGEVAPDEEVELSRFVEMDKHERLGTHIIGSRLRGEKMGTQKCDFCGAWEWDVLSGTREPGWLIKALSLGGGWVLDNDGWVTSVVRGVKVGYKMSFGSITSEKHFGLDKEPEEIEEAEWQGLLQGVGGVKMPVLVKRSEVLTPETGHAVSAISEEHYQWPAGCGIGGLCEDCEVNLTCWGCGRKVVISFYCQLCMFVPDPSGGTSKNSRPLVNLCPERRHGPICAACVPILNTVCSKCSGSFCNVCFPEGIKLVTTSSLHDPYATLNDEELDDIWQEWDETDEYGNRVNGIGRDEEQPPSDPMIWDATSYHMAIAEDEARNAEVIQSGDPGEEIATTVGEVVRQLSEIRVLLGSEGVDAVLEDISAAELPEGYYDHRMNADEYENMGSDVDRPPDDDEMETFIAPDLTSGGSEGGVGENGVPVAPDLRGLPTLITYSTNPTHFPSYQAHFVNELPLKNPPRDQDFDLAENRPIQMYTTCNFCNKTICAVCSKGRVNRYQCNWSWGHCGGCGGMMCNSCRWSECNACHRLLCKSCSINELAVFPRENILAILNLAPGMIDQRGEICLRCMLRKGVSFNKLTAKFANPHIGPMDGYGQEVETNGLVDPKMGLEDVKGELRDEFNVLRGALVGVFNEARGGVEGLLGGTVGIGARMKLNLLCENKGDRETGRA